MKSTWRWPCIVIALIIFTGTSRPAVASPPRGVPFLSEPAYVIEVIDGDTFDVVLEDESPERIRLVGIDAPETKEPGESVQCYGPEAFEKLERTLKPGREIWLERDTTDRDDFNRLLRYVWIEKNNGDVYMLNEVLVRDGFAFSAPYPPDTHRQDDLDDAQAEAIEREAGLWTECPELVSSRTPEAIGSAESFGIASNPECDPSYPTICLPSFPDLNCPDIGATWFEVLPPDPHGLDRDGDGWGCEG